MRGTRCRGAVTVAGKSSTSRCTANVQVCAQVNKTGQHLSWANVAVRQHFVRCVKVFCARSLFLLTSITLSVAGASQSVFGDTVTNQGVYLA